mmetsp:Transcript_29588/g.87688  ORF Transcript_29588/g.87688 Transcript_29588/m.87688 type:complete len:257 (+) Transcript_29588:2055-2825(+)
MSRPVSVPSALSASSQLAVDLFDQPRNILSQTVERLDILHSCDGNDSSPNGRRSFAVHRRVGAGIHDISSSAMPKCFSPKHSQSGGFNIASERQWTLVAYSSDSGSPLACSDVIQLIAIPCGRNYGSGKLPSYFLLSSVLLPKDAIVSDLQFYGDDGCSALTSGIDVKDHEEGRQALGVLVERIALNENADTSLLRSASEELWMLPYDDLLFNVCTCGANSLQVPKVIVDSCFQITSTEDGDLIFNGNMAIIIRSK